MKNWLPRVPRILIIDDILGNSSQARKLLCRKCHLTDVTEVFSETIPETYTSTKSERLEPGEIRKKDYYKVEVVFCSGQNKQRENSLEAVFSILDVTKTSDWDWALVLVDMNFMHGSELEPDIFGPKIVESIVENNPVQHLNSKNYATDIPIIMMTALTELNEIKEQVRHYACGYLPSSSLMDASVSEEDASQKIRKTIEEYGYLEDIGPLKVVDRERLIGRSIRFLDMLRKARRYGRLLRNRQVLILGETGTGKSALAKFLYEQILITADLDVRDIQYFKYQASAGSSEHEQGNLFGNWKGAFTDATSSVPGLAELSHNGVLFIDEIGNWAKDSQTHVLEFFAPELGKMRTVRRLGNFPTEKADIKQANDSLGKLQLEYDHSIQVQSTLITATNEPLKNVFRDKQTHFRSDLFARLIEFIPAIEIPPLRERNDDMELLFQYAMSEVSKIIEFEDVDLPVLDSSAVKKLKESDWPGNLRELFSKALIALEFAKDWGVVTDKNLV